MPPGNFLKIKSYKIESGGNSIVLLYIRGVLIWVFGMYRYLILMPPKEADNR